MAAPHAAAESGSSRDAIRGRTRCSRSCFPTPALRSRAELRCRESRTASTCRRRRHRVHRETRAPSWRADRPRQGGLVHLRGLEGHGLRRGHDRLGRVRRRQARLLPLLQVPPAAWSSLLLRPLPELPDDRRRRPERPRLHRADPGGRSRRGAERPLVARLRLHVRDGQGRRPVHTGRLLLPHVHPPARRVAAVREVPAQRRRARHARPARGAYPPLRHGASARAGARRRRRRGRSRCGARGREGRARSRSRRRGCAARRDIARRRRGARAGPRARNLGGRSRSRGCRHDHVPLPRRADRRRHGCDRAAGGVPRQRPRRRDAPRWCAPSHRLLDQAGRAGDRAGRRRRDACHRRESSRRSAPRS